MRELKLLQSLKKSYFKTNILKNISSVLLLMHEWWEHQFKVNSEGQVWEAFLLTLRVFAINMRGCHRYIYIFFAFLFSEHVCLSFEPGPYVFVRQHTIYDHGECMLHIYRLSFGNVYNFLLPSFDLTLDLTGYIWQQ